VQCSAATKAYNLDPTKNAKELQLWSAHSLRVGACATLYAKGFSEMEIKFLLRWKSNAFMTYLRNLAVTSRRHNEAMNDVSEIPNFLIAQSRTRFAVNNPGASRLLRIPNVLTTGRF
jgi:hypothetical protein